jgi:hypothetical protein
MIQLYFSNKFKVKRKILLILRFINKKFSENLWRTRKWINLKYYILNLIKYLISWIIN